MLNPKTRRTSTSALRKGPQGLNNVKIRAKRNWVCRDWGDCRGGAAGCFDKSICRVLSLLGAMPLDKSTLQAFPISPALPKETAVLITCLGILPEFLHCPEVRARTLAISQSDDRLLSSHMLQRESIEASESCLPFFLSEGSVHLGSMNSLSQASSVFSQRMHLRVEDKALAKAGLTLDGMYLRVGWLSWQTSSNEGRCASEMVDKATEYYYYYYY